METTIEQTNEKVLVVTLESTETGKRRFVVPINSQVSMRVKYYVDNGIKDYLESDLLGEYDLIDLNNFNIRYQKNRNGETEQIYFHNCFNTKLSSNKLISQKSIIRLEEAFRNQTTNAKIYNSKILVFLQSEDRKVNIFLISKYEDNDEDKFIGILETEFTKEKELRIFTLEQIRELGVFSEIPIKPFSTKIYIETGKIVFDN